MGSPIAARREHNAHIQGILQRLLRQIPQTGRQQAIRRSNRCNEIVLRRLNETFDDTPLDRITRQMVDEWYVNARDELTAWTFEQVARTLKRLALWLPLLVGGLRLGEVCALQLRDIDLENLQLHVRHSVNRGPDDRSKYRLCESKTKSSKRVVPIPKPLAPLIEAHISRFCKDRKPDTMLFHSTMLDDWLLPPTTIE